MTEVYNEACDEIERRMAKGVSTSSTAAKKTVAEQDTTSTEQLIRLTLRRLTETTPQTTAGVTTDWDTTLTATTPESNSTSDAKPQHEQLKSGKVRTAESMVICRVTWPHELVYFVE